MLNEIQEILGKFQKCQDILQWEKIEQTLSFSTSKEEFSFDTPFRIMQTNTQFYVKKPKSKMQKNEIIVIFNLNHCIIPV